MFVEPPLLLIVIASVGTLLSIEGLCAAALLSFYLSVAGLKDGRRRLLFSELLSLSFASESVLSSYAVAVRFF